MRYQHYYQAFCRNQKRIFKCRLKRFLISICRPVRYTRRYLSKSAIRQNGIQCRFKLIFMPFIVDKISIIYYNSNIPPVGILLQLNFDMCAAPYFLNKLRLRQEEVWKEKAAVKAESTHIEARSLQSLLFRASTALRDKFAEFAEWSKAMSTATTY